MNPDLQAQTEQIVVWLKANEAILQRISLELWIVVGLLFLLLVVEAIRRRQ